MADVSAVLAACPTPARRIEMLRDRIAIALLLLPVVLWVIGIGGWIYALAIALVLALCAAEYVLIFRRIGQRASMPLVVGGVVALAGARALGGFDHAPVVLAALCLLAMTWHLVDYERGAPTSGTDFALTLGGALYLGWIGSYLISLRSLPDGEWWALTALPSVWLADSAAYSIGTRFGRHKMTPRLSPKKSWEGYLAGVGAGAASGAALGALWSLGAGPESVLGPWTGLACGTLTAVLSPLGDVGISMFKRQVQIKDSGTLLPGHGGALDRVDSWLWAGVLGYYIAVLLGMG
jgi:phosphatidate cytidylyltransferase